MPVKAKKDSTEATASFSNKDIDVNKPNPVGALTPAPSVSVATQDCPMREEKYPQVGEFAMIKVNKIVPHVGAYVSLLEYGNLEGLLLYNEITLKRIRSIRQVVHMSQTIVGVVLRVDSSKGYIDLSKKRVKEEERIKHESWFNQSKLFHSILKRTAASLDLPVKILCQKVGWPLYRYARTRGTGEELSSYSSSEESEEESEEENEEKNHRNQNSNNNVNIKHQHQHEHQTNDNAIHPLDILYEASENEHILSFLDLDPSMKDALLENIVHRLKTKPTKVRCDVRLNCLDWRGTTTIKRSLLETLKELNDQEHQQRSSYEIDLEDDPESGEHGVHVAVSSAPNYIVTACSRNKIKALNQVQEYCESLKKTLERYGGQFLMIKQPHFQED